MAERIKVGRYLLWSKFYLQELIFADRWKNRKKSQNFVPHCNALLPCILVAVAPYCYDPEILVPW